MTLVNWSPFRELDDFFNQYSRLTRGGERSSASVDWRPVADISESDKEYVIRAELPAVDRKDIEVALDDGVITIKGTRKLEKRDDSEKLHRVESFYGSFSRSFALPPDVDEHGIQADSKDGVLTVRLPKTPARKPRPIEVQVR